MSQSLTRQRTKPQVLASGDVDAIAAWQPNSGQALKSLPGSKPIFTSADAPGIIYDLLCVSSESLEANKDEWAKVVKVWYKIVDYLADEANMDDALKILSARVSLEPAEYEPFFKGTKILTLEEAAYDFGLKAKALTQLRIHRNRG